MLNDKINHAKIHAEIRDILQVYEELESPFHWTPDYIAFMHSLAEECIDRANRAEKVFLEENAPCKK